MALSLYFPSFKVEITRRSNYFHAHHRMLRKKRVNVFARLNRNWTTLRNVFGGWSKREKGIIEGLHFKNSENMGTHVINKTDFSMAIFSIRSFTEESHQQGFDKRGFTHEINYFFQKKLKYTGKILFIRAQKNIDWNNFFSFFLSFFRSLFF